MLKELILFSGGHHTFGVDFHGTDTKVSHLRVLFVSFMTLAMVWGTWPRVFSVGGLP